MGGNIIDDFVILVFMKCLPFLFLAGLGTYMFCVSVFPSWREPGWRHWKLYSGCDDPNPNSWGHALGLTKPPKPIAEGDFSEQTAIRIYFLTGLIMLFLAFLGIRHFAGLPPMVPDLFSSLPK